MTLNRADQPDRPAPRSARRFDPENPRVGDRFVWVSGLRDDPPRKATVQRVTDHTVTMLRDGRVDTEIVARSAFAVYSRPVEVSP